MAEKINIATIGVDVNDFITSATSARKEIEKLTEANKLLKTSTGDNTQSIIQNEIELKKQKEVYNQSINSAKLLQTATNELSQAITTEGKSVQQVIQDRNKLIGLAKNIKGSTDEEIALRNKLNTAIDNQTNFIRQNQSEYSKSKDSIGEYKQAVGTLSDVFLKQGGILSTVKGEINGMKAGISSAIETTKNIHKAVIDATTGLIGMGKSSSVASASQKELAVSGTVASASTDKLSKSEIVATATTTALTTVMGALLFPITAIVGAGLILYNVFKDFAPVVNPIKDAFASLGAVFVVLKTGILDLVTGARSLGDVFSSLGSDIADATTETYKLEGAQRSLKKSMDIQEVASARTASRVKELILQSKDLSKTVKERTDLINEAQRLEENEFKNRFKNYIKEKDLIIDRIAVGKNLSDEDKKRLTQGDFEFLKSIAKKKKLDTELVEEYKKNQLSREQLIQEDNQIQEKAQNYKNKLIEKDLAKQQRDSEKAQADEKQRIEANKQAKEKAVQQEKKEKDDAYQKNIQRLNEEIDLYLAQQGTKKKSLQEELVIAQTISDKKKAILDAELLNGKISQEKYQTEILKLDQDVLKAKTDIAIENALIESERAKEKANQELVNEKQKNNELLRIEKEYQDERLKNGLITQAEYDALIKQQKDETKKANAELDAEAKKIDDENKLALELETIALEDQRQRDVLEKRKQEELKNAEKTGADKNLIEAKYKQYSEDLEMQLLDQKLNLAKDGLNALSDVLGKESKAGKAVAVAQSLINTYQGITKALTLPFPANIVAASTTAITGFKAVKDITATKVPSVPKAERGMLIGGLPHSMGGTMIEAERGEAIINKNSVAKFRPLLSSINQMGGGVGFGATATTQNSLINYDLMAKSFEGAISKMPNPQVSVTEINQVNRNYTKVLERANI